MNQLKQLNTKFKEGFINKEEYIQKMHEVHKVLWDYHEFIQNKNIKSIEISWEHIVFTTLNGIKIFCDPEDERIVPIEILNFGDYESDEICMIRRFLKKDSVVLDIGANIGWYCINLSKDVHEGKIIAFEPVLKTFNYLIKNIELNSIRNIEVYNFGLSEKEETREFYYDPKLSGATSLRNLHEDRKKIKIECKVKKMDDFILNITQRIDFIKCDVEGAEIFVIKGGLETLKKTNPVIFLEMLRKWCAKFNYHPNEIIKLLKGIGYQCYYLNNDKLVKIDEITEDTIATNFFFLHPKKHLLFLKQLSQSIVKT